MEKRLRKQAESIFRAALKASDPRQAVLRHVSVEGDTLIAGDRRYDLARYQNIFVIGAGKAGAAMAQAIERLLGKRITAGLVNVKYGHVARLRRIELNECGHPVPDKQGTAGTRRIMEMASGAGAEDLIVCLISGGASALMPAPSAPVTLEEKQETTRLLLNCGANIHEINTVRKHISDVKGGQLARAAYPATVLSLLLSDVIGDPPEVIGSGPTAPDPRTFANAKTVLEKYGIWDRVPAHVRHRLEEGIAGKIADTPKQGDPAFRRTTNRIVGSNQLAVNAAEAEAKRLGLRTMVLSTFIEGEAKDVALVHAAIAKEILAHSRPVKRPACVISGGETTVTIRGGGMGGRNQEFALVAAMELEGLPGVVALSGGTDGTDGPTDAAGAIVDGFTMERAAALGLDAKRFLAANDSYRFFDALGDLIRTGPTNTNVMDVRIVIVT